MLLLQFVNIFATFIILATFCIVVWYNWRRRWLYYYSSKIPGPFSVPLLGTLSLVFAKHKKIFSILDKFAETQPPVFRVWIGPQLYILDSRPEDLEILLPSCLDKSKVSFVAFILQYFNFLLTSEVTTWRRHRDAVDYAFNQEALNSFIKVFAKYGKTMNDALDKQCGDNPIDTMAMVFKYSLDAACGTLVNAESETILEKNDSFGKSFVRFEELITERIFNVWYHVDLLWNWSSLSKETQHVANDISDHMAQLIDFHKSQLLIEENRKKLLLDHLLSADLKQEELEHELLGFVGGTESTSILICNVLLVLSIYPQIQQKIYDSLYSIFGDSTRDVTLEDLKNLDYLNRVIKETMRVFPVVPYLVRYIQKTIKLEHHTLPAGSVLIVPVCHLHRRPEFWTKPLEFDPDRFLPQQEEKRAGCSYIPFSYGPRGCAGQKYGMMLVQTMLSTILRQFRVKPTTYESFLDVEMEFMIIQKARSGYHLSLERRK